MDDMTKAVSPGFWHLASDLSVQKISMLYFLMQNLFYTQYLDSILIALKNLACFIPWALVANLCFIGFLMIYISFTVC